jgi:hypothetical protein
VILNSKNEYASNCLARVCVDMDRYERKRLERLEEEQEKTDLRKLEEFKAKHKRPKRSSPEERAEEAEVAVKKRRVSLHNEVQLGRDEADDLDLGLWLLKGEERCIRVGNLKSRLAEERLEVLKKMREWATNHQEKGSRMRETVWTDMAMGVASGRAEPSPEVEVLGVATHMAVDGVVGGRHPRNKPNTRSCLKGRDTALNMDTGVATGIAEPSSKSKSQLARDCADYTLTSYAAWWRRIEKLEAKFEKEIRKEEDIRRKKLEENRRRKEEKEGFVRKFFPSCSNSPGGTFRLRREGQNINSTGSVAVGKNSDSIHTTSTTLPFMKNYVLQEKVISDSGRGDLTKPVIKLFGGTGWTQRADMEKAGICASESDLG